MPHVTLDPINHMSLFIHKEFFETISLILRVHKGLSSTTGNFRISSLQAKESLPVIIWSVVHQIKGFWQWFLTNYSSIIKKKTWVICWGTVKLTEPLPCCKSNQSREESEWKGVCKCKTCFWMVASHVPVMWLCTITLILRITASPLCHLPHRAVWEWQGGI